MYDWNQTPQNVTLSIPLSYKIDIRKIDSMITENFIKLNIPEMKIFKFIDMFDSIEMETSNVIIEDKKIIFYLNKVNEGKWPQLEFKANSKEELKERRKLAEDNYNKRVEMVRETAKLKKSEFERFVLDQSIKIDEDKRKELKDKKSQEKNDAERELYQFINQIESNKNEEIKTNNNTNVLKISDKENIKIINNEENYNIKQNDNVELEASNKTDNKISDVHQTQTQSIIKNSEIFDDTKLSSKLELNNKSETNLTEIRQQTNFKVNLTEKLIPHFAARESLSKEPPYPKSKKHVPEKNLMGQEIEDRNPIWLKEKADNFFKNKDYRSAVNAYNRAIELDQDFHKCYLNRATSLLLIGEFNLALQDLNKLQYLIENIDQQEKEDMFYTKLLIKAKIKTYAIHAILNDYEKSLGIIDSLLTKENSYIFGDKMTEKIQKDRTNLELRIQSEEDKLKADKFVDSKEFKKAEEIYLNLITKGVENEKILSNLSLIYLNNKDYENTIKYSTDALKLIRKFKEKINLNSKKFDNSLELKMLLRRAESYVEIGEMSKAQEDIETAERFEIRNRHILEKFNLFKEKLKTIVLENYEKSANDLLKKKQFSEALEFYNKSISLIKKKERVDQIKFYLNRISCLLALSQYENATDELTRILSTLIKQRNIGTINSNFNLLKTLKDFEFNIYVKRAFAYTKSNKIESAINDYKSAIEINPTDVSVKRNLTHLQTN